MKKNLLITFFLLCSLFSHSQSVFQTAYGNNDIYEINAMVTDGNYYYVVGTCTTLSSFDKDISFFCIDTDGSLLWSVSMGTNKNDFARSLIRTSDGGFAISGETYGGLIDSTTTDLFLIKTDDQGFPLFAETYGGPADEFSGGVTEGNDGSFYVSGTTASFGNTLESALVLKTDANGIQVWTNVNSSMNSNHLSGILQKSDGKIYASGFCNNDVNPLYKNYVIRLDTNGTLIEARRSGNTNQCILNDMVFTNDGGYATCGMEFFNMGTFNMNVTKYDSSGNRLWNNIYGTNQDDSYSIHEAVNGDLIVTGKTNTGTAGNQNWKSSFLRLNSSGNLIWAKTYGYGTTTSESNASLNGTGNSILAAGIINEPGIGSNAHIIKTDATGNSGCFENTYLPTVSAITFNDSIGADWQLVNMSQFSINPNWQSLSNQFTLYCFSSSVDKTNDLSTMVFPNPGSGKFRIETRTSGKQLLQVFDSTGQIILEKEFYNDVVDVDLTGVSNGIFYFAVDKIKTGKIVLMND